MEEYESKDLFISFLNKRVTIHHIDGITFRGTLRSVDGYLNVVLEDAELDNKIDAVKFEHCFVRGAQVKAICEE